MGALKSAIDHPWKALGYAALGAGVVVGGLLLGSHLLAAQNIGTGIAASRLDVAGALAA